MGDLPKNGKKRKSGCVVMGDLPRWRNRIVMGDLPKKKKWRMVEL
jgi:hypothetical protein